MLTRIASMAALVVLVLPTAGCLVMSGKSVDESGVRITGETIRQVRPGETTEAWLIATLGEPTTMTTVEGRENVRVLRYEHVVSRSEGGAVFLLFAGGSETTSTTVNYFEVIDGIVTRHWQEGPARS